VFEVGGRTLAEMDIAEKNLISHRARAIRSLAEALAR
jgi:inosine/xanthosine triphosphate pyrophosphatase family protein